jgi:very-short-patch-repair endonuclease
MKTKSPMDKIIEAAAQRVADKVHMYAQGDSPIEAILAAAMYAENYAGDHSFDRIALFDDFGRDVTLEPDSRVLNIEPQVTILNYTADFVAYAHTINGTKALVIECDGHDFHERTKEQAAHDRARDRAMQEAGYTVFRFTGSEIYRDPVKCARQVIAWADKEVFG